MTSLTNFSQRQPSWIILTWLVGALGLSGCAEMSMLMAKPNISESERMGTEEAVLQPTPPPAPSLHEVEEAISSTKTLLNDHQKQVGELLSLRGEVKQTLREFRDQNLTPMNSAIESLQHQVGAWEGATATNQATASSAMAMLAQDLEQAHTRVAVYGEQVTALVDQIDQNNRQYGKLLTEFQDSLVGFKEVMGEFKGNLTTETKRATQEERALANQLKEQQQNLDQVALTANDILVLQKRLNQLHVYINQVRDTVTSETTALRAALKNETTDNLQDLVTSLEQRYQQLAQTPPTNPALTEHLQALEHRVEQSEQFHAETVKALHDDIQEISVGMRAALQTDATENLQALVTSLEQRYQQLAQTPPTNPALTEHLQALEHRVEQSEKHHAEIVEALKHDIREVSGRMMTLAQSISAETVEALHHDIQEVSAGMLRLAQSISHLEKTKSSPIPIHAESMSTPRGQR